MKTLDTARTCGSHPEASGGELTPIRIGYLAGSGLLMVVYVFLELFGGHPLEIALGSWTFVAPQAAALLALSRLPFRKALPRGDIDVVFYGALYIGAVAIKLHEVEDLAMLLDGALGIMLFLAISCAPRRAR